MEIVLERQGLRLLRGRALGEVRVRYADLVLDVADAEQLTFILSAKNRSFTLTSQDQQVFEAALAGGAAPLDEGVVRAVRKRGGRRRMTWIVAAVFVVAWALLLAPVYVPYLAAASVDSMPIELDRRIGEEAAAQVQLGADVKDPVLIGAIQHIAQRLLPHAHQKGFEFEVHIVDNGIANAFALPGGRIMVTTGLLGVMSKPEQAAAVVAHEIAHVTERHSVRALARSSGLLLAAQVLADSEETLMALAAQGAAVATMLQHSRAHETEADLEALRILVAAGIDPRAMKEALERIHAAQGDDTAGIPEWLRTHPDLQERLSAIDRALVDLPVPVLQDIAVDWRKVAQSLERSPL